ncbi:protein FAM13C isoform X2 [Pygocentrus nattereri]|uniref:FAM13A-like domain-containing protein n=1 Tax=Pygocentrus nattereri TaxID=42514 RepID=A0AAR2KAG8_PYGNA|nr:protein FAM13C isoform X2 [Pygocentrus nattereri]
MFCFCLQSSLLKLQALEEDSSPPQGRSPEDSPPGLGFKEESQPPSRASQREDSSPQDPRQAESDCIEPQQSPGPSRLIYSITDGNSPLPSPRCASLSLSQRFNTDPESAPSPPCSQHVIMPRAVVRPVTADDAKDAPSIPLLTKHIQTLKRKIRKFEERFEQEMNYKPSHNDKSANPEMFKLMTELARSRKQLKDLKLRQSVEESRGQENGEPTDVCRYSNGQQEATELQQHKPSLEESVDLLLMRLREKRQALGLPDNMKEMTHRQMALEKLTLQKCLLYFESLHGRPGTKQEKNLVKPLYDRYQMVKHLLCITPTITTIEEEEGSDEDYAQQTPPVPRQPTPESVDEDEEEGDSDPAFVSPLDEVKAMQKPAITMSNLHAASRSELLECLRETRVEKKRRRKAIREFEEQFFRQMGRTAQKDDRIPMAEEYQEYKSLKAKLRLLEVLLSKQETTKTM